MGYKARGCSCVIMPNLASESSNKADLGSFISLEYLFYDIISFCASVVVYGFYRNCSHGVAVLGVFVLNVLRERQSTRCQQMAVEYWHPCWTALEVNGNSRKFALQPVAYLPHGLLNWPWSPFLNCTSEDMLMILPDCSHHYMMPDEDGSKMPNRAF